LISLPFLRPTGIAHVITMTLSFSSSQDLEIQKSPLNFSPYEKFIRIKLKRTLI
jgi:hypothetical protein